MSTTQGTNLDTLSPVHPELMLFVIVIHKLLCKETHHSINSTRQTDNPQHQPQHHHHHHYHRHNHYHPHDQIKSNFIYRAPFAQNFNRRCLTKIQ